MSRLFWVYAVFEFVCFSFFGAFRVNGLAYESVAPASWHNDLEISFTLYFVGTKPVFHFCGKITMFLLIFW